MKKNRLTLVAAIFLSGTILFSSCVGSFGLFNRISSWNQSIGTKFVNELVFLALNIVPVYGVAYLADALVINSIEFWSGTNTMANVFLLMKTMINIKKEAVWKFHTAS